MMSTSALLSPNFLKALYAGNMLWHTSALYHFSFHPELMMRKLSKRSFSSVPSVSSIPGGDAWHHDIMKYLGNINAGFVALAAMRLYVLIRKKSPNPKEEGNMDIMALTVLGVANASQAVGNLGFARKSGRWIMGHGFDRITVLDALFAVLDAAVVIARLLNSKA